MRSFLIVPALSCLPRRTKFLNRVLVLLCGTIGTALLGFVTQSLLARGLNVQDYGRLVALLAAVNVVASLASCGMGWFWLHLFGNEGWAAVRWITPTVRASSITFLAGALVVVAYVVLSDHDPPARNATLAVMLVAVLLGQSLGETTAARLQLEERYLVLAGWQLLTQLGRSFVVIAALAAGVHDLTALLGGYAFVGAVMAVISAVSIDQVRRGRIRLVGHGDNVPSAPLRDLPPLRRVFVEAMPYALITVLHLVYSQGIVTVVERSVGPEAAAMYNVAYLVIAAVYLLPSVVYTKYLVGKIFRWWAQDRQMFSAVFHVGIAAHFVIGVIAMAIVIASAPLIIPLLFDERYAPAAPILLLLSIGIPIRFVQHSYGSAFFSKENVPCKIRYMGVAAAASLILNMALIPWLGVYGGAISAVSAEFVLLALYVQGAARHVDGIDIRSTFRVATIRSSLAYIGNSGGRQ